MWRWITGIPRAIRQQLHGPRVSTTVCKEEEVEKCSEDGRRPSLRQTFWANAHRRHSHHAGSGNASERTSHHDQQNAKWEQARHEEKEENEERGPDKEQKWTCPNFTSFFNGCDAFKWGTAVMIGIHLYKIPLWLDKIEREKRRKYENKSLSYCILKRVACAIPPDGGVKKSILSTDKKLHIDTGQLVGDTGQPYVEEEDSGFPVFDPNHPLFAKNSQETESQCATASGIQTLSYSNEEDQLAKVMKEFETACDKYVAQSKNITGLHYARKGEIKEAVSEWTEAGHLGYTKSNFNLAVCYETGKGVRKNHKLAAKYYTLAADEDHPQALYNLALLYINGDGVQQDQQHGTRLMERAAKAGLAQAQTYLGVYYMGDVKHDMNKAVTYFKAAADQNDAEAEYFLGICYEQGWGVEENKCKAASLYAQAASGGHDGAMYNLAVFHLVGLGGLPEDKITAMELLKKAAEAGHDTAIECLKGHDQNGEIHEWKQQFMYDFVQEPDSEPVEKETASEKPGQVELEPFIKIVNSVSTPSLTDYVRKNIDDLQLALSESFSNLNKIPSTTTNNIFQLQPISGIASVSTWQPQFGSPKISLTPPEVSKNVFFTLGGCEDDIESNFALKDEVIDWEVVGSTKHHFTSLVVQRNSTMPNMQSVS